VTNAASVPYDVEVDGPEADREIEDLASGKVANMSMTRSTGMYEIETDPVGPGSERRIVLTAQG